MYDVIQDGAEKADERKNENLIIKAVPMHRIPNVERK